MSRVLPILFNTEMVRAILDGRKTVTRRMIKYPPHPDMPDNHDYCQMPLWMRIEKDEYGFRTLHYMDVIEQEPFRQTRYFESLGPYEKGDILYVRETWRKQKLPDGKSEIQYRADFTEQELECYGRRGGCAPEKWRPSIHMPKKAARIWLKVTDVRVERLHDMTPDDCSEEGIRFYDCSAGFTWKSNTDMKNCYIEAVGAMKALWNSTVKKTDLYLYGWDTNPWVWVIEFERCEKPDIGGNYVAV